MVAIATGVSCLETKDSHLVLDRRCAVRLPGLLGVVTLAFSSALAAPADAQSVRSELGPQARATITIRASVKPMFTVSPQSGDLTVASNVSSGVRYSVVVEPPLAATQTSASARDGDSRGNASFQQLALAEGAASRPGAGQDRLVLIVPD